MYYYEYSSAKALVCSEIKRKFEKYQDKEMTFLKYLHSLVYCLFLYRKVVSVGGGGIFCIPYIDV